MAFDSRNRTDRVNLWIRSSMVNVVSRISYSPVTKVGFPEVF